MREKLPEIRDSVRRKAMALMCPTCGALPKRPCIGTRGNIRIALHADRRAASRGERPA